jgi:hypothetical protein
VAVTAFLADGAILRERLVLLTDDPERSSRTGSGVRSIRRRQ